MLKHRFLLASGMLASVLFILVSEIDGNTRQGYKAYYNTISELSLGSRSWLGISTALIVGILILIFSQALSLEIFNNRSILIFNILGIGIIIGSIFFTDPILGYPPNSPFIFTLRGLIHDISTLIIIMSLITNCFYWGRIYKKIELLKWSKYSYISGYLIIINSIIFVILIILELLKIFKGLPIGVFERITFYTGYIWIFMFSYLVYSNGKYFSRLYNTE